MEKKDYYRIGAVLSACAAMVVAETTIPLILCAVIGVFCTIKEMTA